MLFSSHSFSRFSIFNSALSFISRLHFSSITAMLLCFPTNTLRFHTPSGIYSEHTLQFDNLNCSVLPKFSFGTMTSAGFSQFVVTTDFSACETSLENQYSFLVYLLGLHSRITVTFWTSLPYANLSAYYALVPSFCPSGYDFAIPSSRLHLTVQTLGVAFRLVGNYLPADFHRRALIYPSYIK